MTDLAAKYNLVVRESATIKIRLEEITTGERGVCADSNTQADGKIYVFNRHEPTKYAAEAYDAVCYTADGGSYFHPELGEHGPWVFRYGDAEVYGVGWYPGTNHHWVKVHFVDQAGEGAPDLGTHDENRVYIDWAAARWTNGEDHRDLAAFEAHLAALGADPARHFAFGFPVR